MTREAHDDVGNIEEMSFEECFSELEHLVELFEQGQMPLSQSLEKFERGIRLIQKCSAQLKFAEEKVNQLLKKIEPDKDLSIPGGTTADQD